MGRLCCRLKTRLAVEATGLAKERGGGSGLPWPRAREEQMVEPAGRERRKNKSPRGGGGSAW
jgi:hypothetical protein